MTAGYSGTPLQKKLGIKGGYRMALLGAPAHYRDLLGELPAGVAIDEALCGADYDFLQAFYVERADYEAAFPALKAAGVSRQKAGYCQEIARRLLDGDLDLKTLGRADDDAVRERLMRIRGIGPWTANIYLMTALGRPDIWPEGDLALAAAAQQVKKLEERPDDRRLREMAAGWAPWRPVAARILWHHYLSERAAG